MPTHSREFIDAADFVAACATFEAARGGEAGARLAGLAGNLRALARKSGAETHAPAGAGAGHPGKLAEIGRRIEFVRQNQCEISRLADKIVASARRMTHALHYHGVAARVVDYSKQRADRLRSLVADLETRRFGLGAALTADRDRIEVVERILATGPAAKVSRSTLPAAGPRRR